MRTDKIYSINKGVVSVTLALGISACQPTISDSESLSSERIQTIESLAGVPMQQLAAFDPQEIKQGGDTGITITSRESYSKPSSNLTASRKGDFFIGNAFLCSLGLPLLRAPIAAMV